MKKISLPSTDAWNFLLANCRRESIACFGHGDNEWIERAARNWFNDKENYDGRWAILSARISHLTEGTRVLDMAAGCGTFLLYGLHQGFDVYGIEPENWKREYFQRKITESKYNPQFLKHMVAAVGEKLPFHDCNFDVVTTYQTLEHVQDVFLCLREMVRVLRPGGVLYIRAPDYSFGFEPHYRVFLPPLPQMAIRWYLRMRHRPLQGLESLNWVTKRKIIADLQRLPYPTKIHSMPGYSISILLARYRKLAGLGLSPNWIRLVLILRRWVGKQIRRAANYGRKEDSIELWITRQ